MFSGQGGQHPAMLDFLGDHPAARRVFEEGTGALGTDLRTALKHPDDLYRNSVAQPLICLMQLALWNALQPSVACPTAFAGYSVGELSAYACATAMDGATLARLAYARATLMDQAVTGHKTGMLALHGLRRQHLEALCANRQAWIAIRISAEEFIVGGDEAALSELHASLSEHGCDITCLKVGLAAHTPLIASAVAPFRSLLEGPARHPLITPMLAGIDGTWLTRSELAAAKLAKQLAHTIAWDVCLDTLYERGCRVFLELGPGRALTRMVIQRFDAVQARSVEEFRTLQGLTVWLARQFPSPAR